MIYTLSRNEMEEQVIARLKAVRDQIHGMSNDDLKRLYTVLHDFDLHGGILRRLGGHCSGRWENDTLIIEVRGNEKKVTIRYTYCNSYYYKTCFVVSERDHVKINWDYDQSKKQSEDEVVRDISMIIV